jgi:hypothetical protein
MLYPINPNALPNELAEADSSIWQFFAIGWHMIENQKSI